MMRVGHWSLVVAACLSVGVIQSRAQSNPNASELEGVWIAQSMELGGKTAPPEAIALLRFTFRGEELAIRGNSKGDPTREETVRFTSVPATSPKQFDFVDPNGRAILGIYDIKADVLTVCFRRGPGDRPASFKTQGEVGLVAMVFKRHTQ